MAKRRTKAPSTNGGNGRDSRGRFLPGNPGGPGNPHAAAVGAWRSALAETVTPDDIRHVIGMLTAKAKEGEPWAVRELLNRCLGRPTQAVSVEAGGQTWAEMVAALEAAESNDGWNEDEEN